jgi:hypothetical protein
VYVEGLLPFAHSYVGHTILPPLFHFCSVLYFQGTAGMIGRALLTFLAIFAPAPPGLEWRLAAPDDA